MPKVLTKHLQNKISHYFLRLENYITKPEARCVREMTVGILKSGSVLVNQIASSPRYHFFKPNDQAFAQPLQ